MPSTREQLIEAARELLWERGYEAMSPRAILERSGAGQGSLYHHFSGKAELAATALDEVAGEMQETFDALLQTDKSPLERVKAYLTLPREALRGCRLGRMTQEQAMEQDALRGPIAHYFAHVEQDLAATLEEAQRAGILNQSINAADLAATLLAIVQGGYVISRALQDSSQMDRAIRGALDLLEMNERR